MLTAREAQATAAQQAPTCVTTPVHCAPGTAGCARAYSTCCVTPNRSSSSLPACRRRPCTCEQRVAHSGAVSQDGRAGGPAGAQQPSIPFLFVSLSPPSPPTPRFCSCRRPGRRMRPSHEPRSRCRCGVRSQGGGQKRRQRKGGGRPTVAGGQGRERAQQQQHPSVAPSCPPQAQLTTGRSWSSFLWRGTSCRARWAAPYAASRPRESERAPRPAASQVFGEVNERRS